MPRPQGRAGNRHRCLMVMRGIVPWRLLALCLWLGLLYGIKPLLQHGMPLFDLHLGIEAPCVKSLHNQESNGLIVHRKKLCHGLPPLSPLLLPPLCRLVPCALRFPLRPPCSVSSASAVGALWADETIRVACTPDHAVAQMSFRDVDLEPAVGP
jgi:hypothetical protein